MLPAEVAREREVVAHSGRGLAQDHPGPGRVRPGECGADLLLAEALAQSVRKTWNSSRQRRAWSTRRSPNSPLAAPRPPCRAAADGGRGGAASGRARTGVCSVRRSCRRLRRRRDRSRRCSRRGNGRPTAWRRSADAAGSPRRKSDSRAGGSTRLELNATFGKLETQRPGHVHPCDGECGRRLRTDVPNCDA